MLIIEQWKNGRQRLRGMFIVLALFFMGKIEHGITRKHHEHRVERESEREGEEETGSEGPEGLSSDICKNKHKPHTVLKPVLAFWLLSSYI